MCHSENRPASVLKNNRPRRLALQLWLATWLRGKTSVRRTAARSSFGIVMLRNPACIERARARTRGCHFALAAALAFILNHDARDMPAATHGVLSAAFTETG